MVCVCVSECGKASIEANMINECMHDNISYNWEVNFPIETMFTCVANSHAIERACEMRQFTYVCVLCIRFDHRVDDYRQIYVLVLLFNVLPHQTLTESKLMLYIGSIVLVDRTLDSKQPTNRPTEPTSGRGRSAWYVCVENTVCREFRHRFK